MARHIALRRRAALFALALALCSAAIGSAAGSAAAAVQFSAPAGISGVGSVDEPFVGIDAQDRTSIAWSSYSGGQPTMKSVRVSAAGEPEPVATLAAHTETGGLGLAPDGAVTVVGVRWPQPPNGSSEVLAVRIGADGTVEEPRVLFSQAGWYAEDPGVAVDANGAATVVWRSRSGAESKIEAIRIGADGKAGSVLTLGSDGGIDPQVAVDPAGAATVAWKRLGGEGGIAVDRIDAGGVADPPVSVPGTSQSFSLQPALAVDSQGRATIAWRDGAEEETRVDSVRVAADGTLGPVRTLSDEPLGVLVDPVVAVDAEDRPWVAWSRQEGDPLNFEWSVQVAAFEPDGFPRQPATVSGPDAGHPRITTEGDGYAWLAWDAKLSGHHVVQFLRMGAGGPLAKYESLPYSGADAYSPTPVVDSLHRPALVWREVAPSGQQLVMATGENVTPETEVEAATWQPNADFTFSSPDFLIEGFECRLDDLNFEPCESPVGFGLLDPGHHSFEVRAFDEDGVVDSTPALVTGEVEDEAASGSGGQQSPNWPAGPAPTPPLVLPMPPVPSRGALARAAGSATVAAGIVRLRIVCSGERSCAGTAVLVSGVAGRITRFGQARFDLGPGASEMLRIPVGKRCRQLLAEARGGTLVARLEGHGIEHRRVLLRSAA